VLVFVGATIYSLHGQLLAEYCSFEVNPEITQLTQDKISKSILSSGTKSVTISLTEQEMNSILQPVFSEQGFTVCMRLRAGSLDYFFSQNPFIWFTGNIVSIEDAPFLSFNSLNLWQIGLPSVAVQNANDQLSKGFSQYQELFSLTAEITKIDSTDGTLNVTITKK